MRFLFSLKSCFFFLFLLDVKKEKKEEKADVKKEKKEETVEVKEVWSWFRYSITKT